MNQSFEMGVADGPKRWRKAFLVVKYSQSPVERLLIRFAHMSVNEKDLLVDLYPNQQSVQNFLEPSGRMVGGSHPGVL